jgi:hypothetical protein
MVEENTVVGLDGSSHLLQPFLVTRPFGKHADDLFDFGDPTGHPDAVINNQGRRYVDPVVDHFSPIAIEMNFRFHTGFRQGLADIFQSSLTTLTTFRLAKNVDPHNSLPVPKGHAKYDLLGHDIPIGRKFQGFLSVFYLFWGGPSGP